MQYACRKTLADSRPRVRGRFAKHDDFGENNITNSNHEEDTDEDDQNFHVCTIYTRILSITITKPAD